jgi:hypothetical protein
MRMPRDHDAPSCGDELGAADRWNRTNKSFVAWLGSSCF